jgi:hypothetical protein
MYLPRKPHRHPCSRYRSVVAMQHCIRDDFVECFVWVVHPFDSTLAEDGGRGTTQRSRFACGVTSRST